MKNYRNYDLLLAKNKNVSMNEIENKEPPVG